MVENFPNLKNESDTQKKILTRKMEDLKQGESKQTPIKTF